MRRAFRFLAWRSPGKDVCQLLRCNPVVEILLHAEYRRRLSMFKRPRYQVEQRTAVPKYRSTGRILLFHIVGQMELIVMFNPAVFDGWNDGLLEEVDSYRWS